MVQKGLVSVIAMTAAGVDVEKGGLKNGQVEPLNLVCVMLRLWFPETFIHPHCYVSICMNIQIFTEGFFHLIRDFPSAIRYEYSSCFGTIKLAVMQYIQRDSVTNIFSII